MSTRAALAAVAVGAALLGGAAPGIGAAHADNDTDIAFLETLRDDHISATNGGAVLIEAGHDVCTLRRSGDTQVEVVDFVYAETQLNTYAARYFVGASEAAYCPQYLSGSGNPSSVA